MNVMEDNYEFFNNEMIKCADAYANKRDYIEYFEEEWKEKLGYKDPGVRLKKQNKRDLCNAVNEIIKKYIKYKKETEYPDYIESDKKLFDQYERFFEIDEMSWLYRMTPTRLRGKSPIILSLDPKIMKIIRIRYMEFIAVLGKGEDFGAYWCDNKEHNDALFTALLVEGYKSYKKNKKEILKIEEELEAEERDSENTSGRTAEMADASADRQRKDETSYTENASKKKKPGLNKNLAISLLSIASILTLSIYISNKTDPDPGVLIKVLSRDSAGTKEVCREYEYDEKGNPVTEIRYDDECIVVNELDGHGNVLSGLYYEQLPDSKYRLAGEYKYSYDYNNDYSVHSGSCSWVPYDHLENPDGSDEYYLGTSGNKSEVTFEYDYDSEGRLSSIDFTYFEPLESDYNFYHAVMDYRSSREYTSNIYKSENEETRPESRTCLYYYDDSSGRFIREYNFMICSDGSIMTYSLDYIIGDLSDAGKAGDKVKELGGRDAQEYSGQSGQEQYKQEQQTGGY